MGEVVNSLGQRDKTCNRTVSRREGEETWGLINNKILRVDNWRRWQGKGNEDIKMEISSLIPTASLPCIPPLTSAMDRVTGCGRNKREKRALLKKRSNWDRSKKREAIGIMMSSVSRVRRNNMDPSQLHMACGNLSRMEGMNSDISAWHRVQKELLLYFCFTSHLRVY